MKSVEVVLYVEERFQRYTLTLAGCRPDVIVRKADSVYITARIPVGEYPRRASILVLGAVGAKIYADNTAKILQAINELKEG